MMIRQRISPRHATDHKQTDGYHGTTPSASTSTSPPPPPSSDQRLYHQQQQNQSSPLKSSTFSASSLPPPPPPASSSFSYDNTNTNSNKKKTGNSICYYLYKEYNDFIYIINKTRTDNGTIEYFDNHILTLGHVYGKLIGIYFYRNWTISFFIPLSIVLLVFNIPIYIIMQNHLLVYTTIYDTYILPILMIYIILVGNTILIYGIIDVYKGKRTPPSFIECIKKTITIHNMSSLLLLSIIIGTPSIYILQLLFTMSDSLMYMIDKITNNDTLSIIITAMIDILFMGILLFYITVFIIIVIPCIILEQIWNPIIAMKRSYIIGTGQRFILFIISFIFIFIWIMIEMMSDEIRYNIFEHKQSFFYQLIDALFKWIPSIFFIPLFSILQTVIYVNITHINTIRGHDLLPTSVLNSSFSSFDSTPPITNNHKRM